LIDKAMRAEEWGLPNDAATHYRNAMRVMLEAKVVHVPNAVSSRFLARQVVKVSTPFLAIQLHYYQEVYEM
jgi:hypothetical protein